MGKDDESSAAGLAGLQRAAVAALATLGERPPRVDLIRLGATALFRPADGSVVARVGGTLPEMRQILAIAAALHEAGVPALRPTVDQPLDIGGVCVTIWPYVDGGPLPTSHWLGATARGLHDRSPAVLDALAQRNVQLDGFLEAESARVRDRTRQASDVAGELFDVSPVLERLGSIERAVVDRDRTRDVVVHGDLYRNNTVSNGQDTWLIDFDMVAIGPASVDLAPEVVRERRFPSAGASRERFVEGYGGVPTGSELLETLVLMREMTMVAWLAELAVRRPGVRDEARHRIRTLVDDALHEPWAAV
jgi:aminoglycoside phosphotransferase (APT) family kinase protein